MVNMVRGMDVTKVKKKPWKSRLERDIMLHKDISEAYTQGGKALGNTIDKLFKKTKKGKELDKK
jgi:hypothetical protein